MLRLDPMGRLHAARSADDGRSELVALIRRHLGTAQGQGGAEEEWGFTQRPHRFPFLRSRAASWALLGLEPESPTSESRPNGSGAIASELDAGRPEKALRIVHLHHHKRGHLHDN